MAAKALGQDIFDFFTQSTWPSGYYYDPPYDDVVASIIDDSGFPTLDLNEKYDLGLFDYVCFETDDDSKAVPSFAKLFKKWKDDQTYATVVVQIPKEKQEQVLEILKANGCTVNK